MTNRFCPRSSFPDRPAPMSLRIPHLFAKAIHLSGISGGRTKKQGVDQHTPVISMGIRTGVYPGNPTMPGTTNDLQGVLGGCGKFLRERTYGQQRTNRTSSGGCKSSWSSRRHTGDTASSRTSICSDVTRTKKPGNHDDSHVVRELKTKWPSPPDSLLFCVMLVSIGVADSRMALSRVGATLRKHLMPARKPQRSM